MLSYVKFLKSESAYHSKTDKCYTTVVKKLISIWEKTDIPTITYCGIRKKLIKLVDTYKAVKIKAVKYNCSEEDYLFLTQMFNISQCKCIQKIQNKSDAKNFNCECPYKSLLNSRQYEFFKDQVYERIYNIELFFVADEMHNLSISPVSKPPTLAEPISPSAPSTTSPAIENNIEIESITPNYEIRICNNANEKADDSDPEYVPEVIQTIPRTISLPESIAHLDFDAVCVEGSRNNCSTRQLAAIINRSFEMLGAINDSAKGLVVTPSLLQKKQKKIGAKLSKASAKENVSRKIDCFFFDGITAKNLVKTKRDGKMIVDRSTEFENIILVEQPHDRYLGFVSMTQSDAQTIFDEIKKFLLVNKIDLANLIAIGSDGAATNVGVDNGVIKKFEDYLNCPLHRIICLLHLLELLIKAMIIYFYGSTKAPSKFTGQINEKLTDCDKWDVVDFVAFPLENMPLISNNGMISTFDSSKLIKDQKLLFDLAEAVSTGHASINLARRKPGSLSNIRWTTYAARFLRLYISTKSPSFKLISMINFIQKIYVPMLLSIKCYPEWIYAPKHIFNILSHSQNLPMDQFTVIKERIQFNSYFVHSESILLAMISDKDKTIRNTAYEMIITLRNRDAQTLGSAVRTYTKPKIYMKHPDSVGFIPTDLCHNPTHYSELLNWNDMEAMHEPPFLKRLPLDELNRYMRSDAEIINIPPIPAHSQATEHNVQLVKSVITKYVGHETQEARIQTKIRARSLNREFNQHYRKSLYESYQSEEKAD